MGGWKTWTGGIGMVLSGLGIVITAITSGDYSHMTEGTGLIAAGIAAIGLGFKIEKAV